MTTFRSMPNSFANHQFLLNIQTYSKVNRVNQVGLVSYLEQRILDVLQNSYDFDGVTFHSLQIEQRSGDLILNVMEDGKLQRYINPSNELPFRGLVMHSGDWGQHEDDVNAKGEPIDENGMTKDQYAKNEEDLTDFGWEDIIWGKQKPKPEPDTQSHSGRIDQLNDQLQYN